MIRSLVLILFLIPAVSHANDWDALKQPGAFALMRHALAPGMNEPGVVDMDDCATQRNLDDAGRAQARAIGDAFRAHGIAFDGVLTSQWCRCRETADMLGLGRPVSKPGLSMLVGQQSDLEWKIDEARALITTVPGRNLFVTHQDIIRGLTGLGTASGEVLILRRNGDTLALLGRILIAP